MEEVNEALKLIAEARDCVFTHSDKYGCVDRKSLDLLDKAIEKLSKISM